MSKKWYNMFVSVDSPSAGAGSGGESPAPGPEADAAQMVAQELGMKKYDLFNPAQNLALLARYDQDIHRRTGNWPDTMDAVGTGSGVIKVQMELGGRIQVVDANGKVYGYIDANTLVGTTKATVHRAPVASRHPAPNPHGGGHHSQ